MITSYTNESILKRAQEKNFVMVAAVNPRDYTQDKHHKVDEKAYGGGPGMVMTAQPLIEAAESLLLKGKKKKVVMLSPSGIQFTNSLAKKWAKSYSDIVFICGRYEGVDDRVRKILKAQEVSIGPYVVTGGELPALIMADAVTRQIPGVLGKEESLEELRAASPRTYTRPEVLVWKGKQYKVPKVLLSGNHKEIETWRKKQGKE